MKTYLKKGDNVQVISGKEKGKKGRVISIVKNKYGAIVEGLNLVSKRTKPNSDNQRWYYSERVYHSYQIYF